MKVEAVGNWAFNAENARILPLLRDGVRTKFFLLTSRTEIEPRVIKNWWDRPPIVITYGDRPRDVIPKNNGTPSILIFEAQKVEPF